MKPAHLACLAATVLASLSQVPRAQSTKLSLPFAPGPTTADVLEFCVTPDGSTTVYFADQDGNGAELYARPSDGSGSPVRLNAPLSAGIHAFEITPDGGRVLYHATVIAGTSTQVGLFSVPIDASALAIRLDGPASNNEDVTTLRISPDGSRAVFLKGFAPLSTYQLLSAPTDGSANAISLSGGLNARAPVLSADGTKALFGAADGGLHVVPVDGSAAPLRLNGDEELSGRYLFTPDGARVVFAAGTSLFSAPLDGSSTPTLLSGAENVIDNTPFVSQHIEFSSDGQRILFNAPPYPPKTFSAPLDGSAVPIQVAPAGDYVVSPASNHIVYKDDFGFHRRASDASDTPLFLAPPPGIFSNLAFSATGERLVWAQSTASRWQLASVPADGSGSVVWLSVNANPASSAAVFQIAPDGLSVLYIADGNTAGVTELYRVPIDGGTSARLNPPLPPGGGVQGPAARTPFAFSSDGQHAFYLADQQSEDVIELFRTRADGSGGLAKLNGPLASVALGDVTEVRSTSDGARVVYHATTGLFSAPADGSALAVCLNGPPIPTETIDLFAIAPGDQRVIFVTGPWQSTTAELYSVPIDGGGLPVRLDGGLVAGGDVLDLRLAPDGVRAVFLADKDEDEVRELYVVPLDGSAAPMKLSGTLVPGGDVGYLGMTFEISPDGRRVVYVGDQRVDERPDLNSVPIDGSAAPIRLGSTTVSSFRLSPDGARAVYFNARSFQDGISRGDLYSVPIDGGGPALRLNPTSFGSRVFSYAVGPTQAVFLADRGSGGIEPAHGFYVYGALLDGSVGPLRLCNPQPPTAGRLPYSIHLVLSPDGTRVVFTLDPLGFLELFSAPVDGSAAAQRLNHAFAPGTELSRYFPPLVSPDGEHVLYQTLTTFEKASLYVAPLRGGSQARRLDHVTASGSVYSAGFSADGLRVLYRAVPYLPQQAELFTVPVWGGPSARLSVDLIPQGVVTSFLASPDGQRAFYLADQETNEVFELFATPLPALKLRRRP